MTVEAIQDTQKTQKATVELARTKRLAAQLDTPKFRRFLYSLKSPETVEGYSKAILAYVKYRKLDKVNDLLGFGIQETEDVLIDYLIYLQSERKLSWHSRQLYGITALKKYYDMSRMVLNWKL